MTQGWSYNVFFTYKYEDDTKKWEKIFLQDILVIISNDENDDERQYIQFRANFFLWPYSTFVLIYMARILDFNFTNLQWNCVG